MYLNVLVNYGYRHLEYHFTVTKHRIVHTLDTLSTLKCHVEIQNLVSFQLIRRQSWQQLISSSMRRDVTLKTANSLDLAGYQMMSGLSALVVTLLLTG